MSGKSETPMPIVLVAFILKAPFLLLGYLFKHKILLAMVVIGLVVFFGARTIGQITSPKPSVTAQTLQAIPAYQQIAPTTAQAPQVLRTASRIYYVSTFTEDKRYLTLTKFYVYDSKQWQLITMPLVLDKAAYGGMKLYNR